MKVLHINAYYDFGSTGCIVKDMFNYQWEHGIEAYVIYGKNNKHINSKYIIFCGNKFSFVIHKFLYNIFGNALNYSFFSTKKIIKMIGEIQPDIIHLHNMHDYYINNELLFRYIINNNIKIVWTFHDCWAFTGHCCHYEIVNCNKWQTECNKCPMQRKGPRSMLFDRSREFYYKKKKLFNSLKKLDIVCVSKWLQAETKKSFLKNNNIRTIYNWIDSSIFYPEKMRLVEKEKRKYGINKKYIIFGLSFNWTANKGFYDFIELSKRIDNDKVIVLMGKIIDNKFNANLPSNIIVVPPSRDKNILRLYYSMADVFINPSKVETFGLTTAESMACGTPAIVYDNSASPEIIGTNGECGEIVKYDNNRIDSIIKVIDKMNRNPKQKYCKNCLKRVKEKFDKSKNIKKYCELYQE